MVRKALKGKLMKSKNNKRKRVNPKYKDRVFKFIFGNPANKEWTLALYNGVNGSNHKNPDDILFNTIDDAAFSGLEEPKPLLSLNSFQGAAFW